MSAQILPPAIDAAEHDAELDAHLDALADEALSAFDAEASASTRDDGLIYHGRLPCDDADSFNPSIIAHAPILPPADDLPPWMERRHGSDPVGTGLPLPAGWSAL